MERGRTEQEEEQPVDQGQYMVGSPLSQGWHFMKFCRGRISFEFIRSTKWSKKFEISNL